MAFTSKHELSTLQLPDIWAPVGQQIYLKVSNFKGINLEDLYTVAQWLTRQQLCAVWSMTDEGRQAPVLLIQQWHGQNIVGQSELIVEGRSFILKWMEWWSQTYQCLAEKVFWEIYGICCFIFHHHHHHVYEGLGMFPVPWSSRCSWSLHLFLGHPTFLRPFGLYCSACFGSLFVSTLCTCCSHFCWYYFILGL